MTPKILILGGGSMGSLFAALIYRGIKKNNSRAICHFPSDITLLARSANQVRALKKYGMKISGVSRVIVPPNGIKFISHERMISVLRDKKSASRNTIKKRFYPADLILVLVKSHDTESAVLSTLPFIGENTIILTLQNGLGNFETIKKALATDFDLTNLKNKTPPVILSGITTHGAMKISDNRIVHTGKGEIIISYDTDAEKISAVRARQILVSSGLSHKDISIVKGRERLLWSKLIINAAINPVGAVFNIKNGEILKNDFALNLAISAAREAENISRLYFEKKRAPTRPIYRNIVGKIRSVLRATAPNRNSMLQDTTRSRPTEIDAISGAIVRLARRYGTSAPINRLLYNSVKIIKQPISIKPRHKTSPLSSDFV